MNSAIPSANSDEKRPQEGRQLLKGRNLSSSGDRNLWPGAIVAFFAIAILGLAGFVVFCQLHPSELVANDYYEQEIRYHAEMERLKRAHEISEHVSVTFDVSARRVVVALPREHAVAGATGVIQLYRPSEARLDRSCELRLRDDGTQDLETGTLRPGLWRVRIRWVHQGQEYLAERRLEVPA